MWPAVVGWVPREMCAAERGLREGCECGLASLLEVVLQALVSDRVPLVAVAFAVSEFVLDIDDNARFGSGRGFEDECLWIRLGPRLSEVVSECFESRWVGWDRTSGCGRRSYGDVVDVFTVAWPPAQAIPLEQATLVALVGGFEAESSWRLAGGGPLEGDRVSGGCGVFVVAEGK